MNIKILSDSTCDLSPEQLKEHDISLARLTVIKDGEGFIDGLTITPADIFAHVAAGGDLCTTTANNMALQRRVELINLFNSEKEASATKDVPYQQMVDAIQKHVLSDGYKSAVSNDTASVTSEQLLADYTKQFNILLLGLIDKQISHEELDSAAASMRMIAKVTQNTEVLR